MMLPSLDFMMVWIPAVLVFAARVEDDEVATVGSWGLGVGAEGFGLRLRLCRGAQRCTIRRSISRRPAFHGLSRSFSGSSSQPGPADRPSLCVNCPSP